MTYRREFMLSLGAATAALGVGLSLPAAAKSALAAGSRSAAERFAPHLGASFEFAGVNSPRGAQATLVEIVDRGCDAHVDQFELVFRAPAGQGLDEAVFRMTTPSGERSEHLVQPLAGLGSDRNFSVHFSLLG